MVDGVPVRRAPADLKRPFTKIAVAAMVRALLRDGPAPQTHLHGFCERSALLILLARIFGKRVFVKSAIVRAVERFNLDAWIERHRRVFVELVS